MSKLKTGSIAVLIVMLVALAASAFGGSFATASSTASATRAVPVPTCTKPTNNPTHQQQVNYAQCLHQRETAQLQNMEERLRGPVPTATETVTVPGPTATVTVTETVTATPTPTSTSTPTPTDPPTTDPPSGEWPNASNTGVPSGVTLQPYTGPCILQAATTIDAKDVKAKCGELILRTTAPVTITRSRLPRVENTNSNALSSMVTIKESNIEGGAWFDGTIWGWNFNIDKSEITGGQHNVHANENVTVTNSWLHAQHNPVGGSYHTNAFLTNGGSKFVLKGNTLHCDSILNSTDGGCTADVSLFGDFDPVSDVLVEGNLLKANNSSISYCAYGGHNPGKNFPNSTYIRYINNVFERGANNRCGVYGPVTSFDSSATGNVWSGNVWTTGEPVPPAD